MKQTKQASFMTLMLCLAWSVNAQAADVGEIALIEDVNGSINSSLFPTGYVSKAACAFFTDHEDRYDALFIFQSTPLSLLNASPMGWAVKQQIKGIGRDIGAHESNAFCSSNGTLRHVVRMGHIGALPDDPEGLYTGIPNYGLSGIAVMGHEFGHYWMALIGYDKGDGVEHCNLRNLMPSASPGSGDCDGYTISDWGNHWSYFFNTSSVMYGSAIKDLGNGSFEISHSPHKYSPLDQYLMGLRHPSDVPPTFLVDVSASEDYLSGTYPLMPGQTDTVQGTRVEITVDDVIRAEGARVPPTDPCHWTGAFMIVHPTGNPPTADQIAKVDAYRARWETFYAWATDDRGSFDTTLNNSGQATCAGAETPADAGVPDSGGADGAVTDGGAMDTQAPDQGSPGGGDGGVDTGDADGGGDGCSCNVGSRDPGAGLFSLALICLLLLLWRRD